MQARAESWLHGPAARRAHRRRRVRDALPVGWLLLLGLASAQAPVVADGLPVVAPAAPDLPAPFAAPDAALAAPRFRELPPEVSGLHFEHRAGASGTAKRFMLECVGAGMALFDVEEDGDLDLYLVQAGVLDERGAPLPGERSGDTLALNDGSGRFREYVSGQPTDAGGAALQLGTGFGFGATAGDLDDDGDEDLLVTNLGLNELLLDVGGVLQRCDDARGLAGGADEWSTGAAFGDVDGDGDLDAYVANYLAHDLGHPLLSGRPCRWLGCEVPCGPQGLTAQRDHLYLNDGGRFRDVSASALAQARPTYAFQPVFSDLDQDGDLDIFVAVDSQPNTLWVNQGPAEDGQPRFVDQALRSGLALSDTGKEQAGMGLAVGDVDGDLRFDLVMTNFSREPNAFYRNASEPDFGLLFFDEAGRMGLGRPSYLDLGWGVTLFDADLDGDRDLFVANGHVYPQVDGCGISQVSFAQADKLFVMQADGRFTTSASEPLPGVASVRASRGAASGDLDGDGDVDLVVGTLDGPTVVLENVSPRVGTWVQLDLQPSAASVGARVLVTAGGRQQLAEVRRGSSFLGCEPRAVHFGLPPGAERCTVRVDWLDGRQETWNDVPTGRRSVLVRGQGSP